MYVGFFLLALVSISMALYQKIGVAGETKYLILIIYMVFGLISIVFYYLIKKN